MINAQRFCWRVGYSAGVMSYSGCLVLDHYDIVLENYDRIVSHYAVVVGYLLFLTHPGIQKRKAALPLLPSALSSSPSRYPCT